MEILADLLDQWEKNGLPEMPSLMGIGGLPKFETAKFDIEDHWTSFIDKTVSYWFMWKYYQIIYQDPSYEIQCFRDETIADYNECDMVG